MNKYSLGEKLGEGGKGIVYKCEKLNEKYVIKKIKDGKNSKNEVHMMKLVKGIPGVVEILDHFEEDGNSFIVMEYLENHLDLFDFITNIEKIKEDSAKFIFDQILNSVEACFGRGVFPGDIKDENIIIDKKSLKTTLIDFGNSKEISDNDYNHFYTTDVYSPPEWIRYNECLKKPFTVWSLGILLFNMVNGDVPFETHTQIEECNLDILEFFDISEECKDLIRNCLEKNTQKRINLADIKKHIWMKK